VPTATCILSRIKTDAELASPQPSESSAPSPSYQPLKSQIEQPYDASGASTGEETVQIAIADRQPLAHHMQVEPESAALSSSSASDDTPAQQETVSSSSPDQHQYQYQLQGHQQLQSADPSVATLTDADADTAAGAAANTQDDGAEPVAHESGEQEDPVTQEPPADFVADDQKVDALDLPLGLKSLSGDDSSDPDRLVPVLTFSGAPAHRIIRKFQVKPDPLSVPRITRASIEQNASLTGRQKNYLSKILDDYYKFIVSNVKNIRRRYSMKKKK
jgi:hypothetical protein